MKIKPLIYLLLAVLSLSSCVHRNFEYDDRAAFLEVVFDWRNAPDANPSSMTLFMFPEKGGAPRRFDFRGRDGGIIHIAPGKYKAICVNGDSRGVEYIDDNVWSDFQITTSEMASLPFGELLDVRTADLPRAAGAEGQKIFSSPPLLWSSSEITFDVKVDVRGNKDVVSGAAHKDRNTEIDHQVLYMYPKCIVDTYVVTVKKVRNAQYLYSFNGTLSDMSSGYLAGPQMDTDDAVMIPFSLALLGDRTNAEGTFLTFGHCPDLRRTHKLVLYAVLTDGSRHYYEFDVSDQAHNPPDENGIYHIVVEFIDIPEPTGNSFDKDVNDWNSVDIFIPL